MEYNKISEILYAIQGMTNLNGLAQECQTAVYLILGFRLETNLGVWAKYSVIRFSVRKMSAQTTWAGTAAWTARTLVPPN